MCVFMCKCECESTCSDWPLTSTLLSLCFFFLSPFLPCVSGDPLSLYHFMSARLKACATTVWWSPVLKTDKLGHWNGSLGPMDWIQLLTHGKVKGENPLPKVVLWPWYSCRGTYTYEHKIIKKSQAWWDISLILALGRQRQVVLCELESSLRSTKQVPRQPWLLHRELLSWKTKNKYINNNDK